MRIATIVQPMSADLTAHASNCLTALTARPDFAIHPSKSIASAPDADLYLLLGDDIGTLSTEVNDAAKRSPSRLPATILAGVAPGFLRGLRDVTPGTAVELLERFRLGGCFAPQALMAWSEAPSWFTGPKDLMEALGSNAIKAHQSEHYAAWFSAPGPTLSDFLVAYVRATGSRVA